MKISIAIPTYEYHGQGWLYLSHLLNSITSQTYDNWEVIISDQSKDDKIKQIADIYSQSFSVKYFSASTINKMGENFNNAIKHCEGDAIKIMCCDDFFIDTEALAKIKDTLNKTESRWILNATVHCNDNIHRFYDYLIPKYNDQLHLGKNTISSPTALTLRSKEYFDESLFLLLDCEMYKRLYVKYGNPEIITEPLVCNRMHKNQAQKIKNIDSNKEVEYCRKLYE